MCVDVASARVAVIARVLHRTGEDVWWLRSTLRVSGRSQAPSLTCDSALNESAGYIADRQCEDATASSLDPRSSTSAT